MFPCLGLDDDYYRPNPPSQGNPDQPDREEEEFICLALECQERFKRLPVKPAILVRPDKGKDFLFSPAVISLRQPLRRSLLQESTTDRPKCKDGPEDDETPKPLPIERLGTSQCLRGMVREGAECKVRKPQAGKVVAFRQPSFATLVIPNENRTVAIVKAVKDKPNRAPSGWITHNFASTSDSNPAPLHFVFDLNGTSVFTLQPGHLQVSRMMNLTIVGVCRPEDENSGYNCSNPFTLTYDVPYGNGTATDELAPIAIFVFFPHVRITIHRNHSHDHDRRTAARRLLQSDTDTSDTYYLMSWQRYYDAEYVETSCPIGSFLNTTSNDSCVPCPDRKTTLQSGSTSPDQCLCKLGHYDDGLGSCTACDNNKTTTAIGALSQSKCRCPVDTYAPLNQSCTPCPAGASTGDMGGIAASDCVVLSLAGYTKPSYISLLLSIALLHALLNLLH